MKPEIKLSADDALRPSAVDVDAMPVRKSRTTLKVLGALVGITIGLGGIWMFFGDAIMHVTGGGDGAIPTISANPAPVKVRPENPGGMQVPNQGRLVYGVVDGSAGQPRMERLLPEAEKPLDVDQVLKKPVPEASSVAAGSAPRGTADPPPLPPEPSAGGPRRLVAPAQPGAAPVRPAPSAVPSAPVATQELARVPTEQDVATLRRPEPAPPPPAPPSAAPTRTVTAPPSAPSRTVTAPPPSVPAAPAQAQTAQIRPAPTPAPAAPTGNLDKVYRVQLAATRSEEAVKSEWDSIRRRNIDLLGELALQVARVDLGPTKGVFYRLRVGPLADETAAKTLCERLKQRKLGCLVIKPGG